MRAVIYVYVSCVCVCFVFVCLRGGADCVCFEFASCLAFGFESCFPIAFGVFVFLCLLLLKL